jgi:Ran GTPase-activating protein (RanGAP) involved in mRNA processing and transport
MFFAVCERTENIILLPEEKSKSLINALDAESLAVALSENESLVSLALEEIHLSSLNGIHRFASALMKHTSIQRLTLYGNKLGDEGVLALLNAFVNPMSHASIFCGVHPYHHAYYYNNSLQTLCLCGNQIGDKGAYWIAEAMKSKRNLTELDLSSNEITSQGAIFLADMLSCCSLTTFILNGNRAQVRGALAITTAAQYNPSLEVLGLCGNNVGDEGAIHLSHMAKTHPSLKAMLLEDNFIGDRGILAISDAHRHNPRLGMMEVSWNLCSKVAMDYIAASMQNLVYLYLDRCEIGDSQIEILAKALHSNRSICDLYLEGNHIGYLGARHLATALEVNHCLEGLFLADGNPLSRQGAHTLCNVLRTSNTTMKRLQIHDEYHDVQREMDVYLDMNGAGRKCFILPSFPQCLLTDFFLHNDILSDPDLIYLFIRERPDLFQNSPLCSIDKQK